MTPKAPSPPGTPLSQESIPDVFDTSCSARHALELISTKWAILIISAIATGPMRNGELRRKVGGISQKMMTQTLRDLERNGLVLRNDLRTVPPHVEYRLTAIGLSLGETLVALDRWAEQNFPELDRARVQYDCANMPSKKDRRAGKLLR